jgi:hypothetical protein
MRCTPATFAALLMVVLGSQVAVAQTAQAPPAGAPATSPPKQPTDPQSRYWLVSGVGLAGNTTNGAHQDCSDCPRASFSTNGPSVLVDVGMRMNSRLDFGIEVVWGNSKIEEGSAAGTMTTFVLGVAQVRPWHTRGFFFRTGMGSGVIGHLQGPFGGELEGTHTTNTMALMYGAGWVFQREKRFALQVHGTHHIAALGELKVEGGRTYKNVLNNYWTVLVGFVFR